MPAKNTIKKFFPEQMWHIYNRGVDKRNIFLEENDYKVFLSYLKCALQKELDNELKIQVSQELQMNRVRRLHLYDEVELVSYCLMPNHFHLQLYQYSEHGISKLMRSVSTGYAMYFNAKYKRQGTLFQGVYRGVCINSDSYWLHLSRYIHLNPLDINANYLDYEYSSYKYYIEPELRNDWLHIEKGLVDFKSSEDYATFCEEYVDRKDELRRMKNELADA